MTAWHNDPISPERAKALLALPLEDKALTSWEKIGQWYTAWGGKCYVSFSGGWPVETHGQRAGLRQSAGFYRGGLRIVEAPVSVGHVG